MCAETERDVDVERAIGTAWSVHTALGDWTGRVDGKASIFLTLESALLAAVVSSSGSDGRLAAKRLSSGLENTTYWIGVGALCGALILAAGVVVPQLRRWRTRKAGEEWRTNVVYFGHLRHWDPADLQRELLRQPEALESLSRQMVRMSKISWRKHSWTQLSMLCALLGTGSIVLCLLLVR